MIRFLVRVLGLLLVAAGFVGLVVDGTRSIANYEIAFTPLGEVLFQAFPESFPMLEPAITRHVSPVLWDPVLLTILLWPASIVAFVLGALLLWLSQKRPEPVGYLTER
ncbi:hypothetical protein [Salinarimonas rosea]|uniref:hypothetical protein n=1 Tax=Salinarimonas rosea TaxID=552063 RepID=UPI0003F5270E|nr:hypothetical protein [Salinarimonas rosea]